MVIQNTFLYQFVFIFERKDARNEFPGQFYIDIGGAFFSWRLLELDENLGKCVVHSYLSFTHRILGGL